MNMPLWCTAKVILAVQTGPNPSATHLQTNPGVLIHREVSVPLVSSMRSDLLVA